MNKFNKLDYINHLNELINKDNSVLEQLKKVWTGSLDCYLDLTFNNLRVEVEQENIYFYTDTYAKHTLYFKKYKFNLQKLIASYINESVK